MRNDLLVFIGFSLIAVSIFFHLNGKNRYAVFSVFLAAVSFRLFAIYLDPFLHDWDEKFHALVAKNMIANPFEPVLVPNSVIPNTGIDWCCSHIWLHKQPLFLWQMALSLKIFGINEFALRYPSMMLGALMIPLTYRTAYLLTNNERTSLGAAILFCVSNYHLDLISGRLGIEHNDVAFGFYILASIWAYMEYLHRKSWKWVVLIGLFAGCAILNKWLTGLLVYAAWGMNILIHIRDKDFRNQLLNLLLSLIVCVLVFMPWQLYINYKYPAIASFEREFNFRHVTEVIEGHNGGYRYYFDYLSSYIGEFIWMFFLLGFFITIFTKSFNRKAVVTISTIILVTVIFFSFIVKTKMISFVFILAPFAFIYVSIFIHTITTFKTKRAVYYWVALLLCVIPVFNYPKLHSLFSNQDEYRNRKIANTVVFKQLNATLPSNTTVIMNTKDFENIEVMFYVDNRICYNYSLSKNEIDILKSNGVNIAVFKDRYGCNAIDEVVNYDHKYLIPFELK